MNGAKIMSKMVNFVPIDFHYVVKFLSSTGRFSIKGL